MSDIADLSAIDLSDAIRRGAVSSLEAVEAAFARIEALSHLNAFMALARERALVEARAADRAWADGETLGLLHGLPFSVKDLTNTADLPTTMGSALFADNRPAEDAVAVARARQQGAILIGKTTSPEFGHKAFTEGPFFGRTLNPRNPGYTCGGSSGGAAVAVACGMGPIALGSDGGGSIRIPAACCGVVGLKASLGVIPNLQAPDLFGANSYVGPMARSVAEVRLLFEALAGPDRRDPYGQSEASPFVRRCDGPLRIGLLLKCGNRLDPVVEAATLAAMREAEALGMAVEPVEIDFVALEPAFLVFLRTLLRSRLLQAAETTPELLDPTLIATIEAGAGYSAVDLANAQVARSQCFTALQALFKRVDIIASPTLSAPPLPVGLDPLGEIEIAGQPVGTIRGAWYPYTYPFNLTGHPAITLPSGLTAEGLPIGLQLAGPWHSETLLLQTAERLEAAIGFDRRAVHPLPASADG